MNTLKLKIENYEFEVPVFNHEGKKWVALKPLCEVLGVSNQKQQQKVLQSEIYTTQEYGRYQIINDKHSLSYEETNLLLNSAVLMRCRADKSVFAVDLDYVYMYVEDMK